MVHMNGNTLEAEVIDELLDMPSSNTNLSNLSASDDLIEDSPSVRIGNRVLSKLYANKDRDLRADGSFADADAEVGNWKFYAGIQLRRNGYKEEDPNVGKEGNSPINQQNVVDTNFQDNEGVSISTPSGASQSYMSQSLFSFSAFSLAKSKDNADMSLGGLSEL